MKEKFIDLLENKKNMFVSNNWTAIDDIIGQRILNSYKNFKQFYSFNNSYKVPLYLKVLIMNNTNLSSKFFYDFAECLNEYYFLEYIDFSNNRSLTNNVKIFLLL